MVKIKCNKCDNKGIFQQPNQILCKNHFLTYFENKIFKTIKKYNLFNKEDKVCIAASGGKDSLAALYLTMKYCRQYNIDFFALVIDEGIAGYRNHTIDDLKHFCDEHEIPLEIVSFKEKMGKTLDQVREQAMKELNKKPCTICGIFRRTYLNRTSRELGATKLVTGHNLDDESQSFMMNVLMGNMRRNAGLGPISGITNNPKFVPRVKPLYFVSEKETRLFCLLKKFKVEFNECPNISLSYRAVIRDQINQLENKFPGSKHAIVNSFLEILPNLKDIYRDKKEFDYCTKCQDPCAGNICNACQLEEKLCAQK